MATSGVPGVKAASVAGAVALALSVSGCGSSDRSPTAYCEAYYVGAAPLVRQENAAAGNAASDPLGALATGLASIGGLETVFDSMDQHAPADIEPATAQVRDSLKSLESSAGQGPLNALASGLISSLMSADAYQQVGNYLNAHCPLTSALAQRYVGDVGSENSGAASSSVGNSTILQRYFPAEADEIMVVFSPVSGSVDASPVRLAMEDELARLARLPIVSAVISPYSHARRLADLRESAGRIRDNRTRRAVSADSRRPASEHHRGRALGGV